MGIKQRLIKCYILQAVYNEFIRARAASRNTCSIITDWNIGTSLLECLAKTLLDASLIINSQIIWTLAHAHLWVIAKFSRVLSNIL